MSPPAVALATFFDPGIARIVLMVFVYYAQGVGGLYTEFVERLMSQLALRGTEITHENLAEDHGSMDVKQTDEEGSLEFAVSGRDVKATYQVKRYRREIEKGAVGAVAGGALGSVLGSIGGLFNREQSITDTLGGAVAGAAAGGAWQAYSGWDQSKQERTRFAEVLAEAARVVEDELQYIQQGQDAARDALKEKARARREEEDGKVAGIRGELEDVYGDALALGEELELLAEEGQTVTKSRARVDRAQKLYAEADAALEAGDLVQAKAKTKAARQMVDAARSSVGE
jgi:outer membrane lipoprotein SlyB